MEEASTEAKINITGVESTALIDLPSELNITGESTMNSGGT
jgi:hypothetical protein